MGLYGMMRTGVSGMAAQANRLATVAEQHRQFEHHRLQAGLHGIPLPSSFPGRRATTIRGGVKTSVRYAISQQGPLQFHCLLERSRHPMVTASSWSRTPPGRPFLARAGTFVPDGQGRLVNAAGFLPDRLQLRKRQPGCRTPTASKGSRSSRSRIPELAAEVTTEGVFSANLPADAEIGDTEKSSLVVYDYMGRKKIIGSRIHQDGRR